MPARRASAPLAASCNHTEMLALSRMPAAPAVARWATSAMVVASASSRENSSALRALGFASLRLVQACVLECDGGVSGQDLEQPKIVRIELIETELRDHDDAGDARPVPERHREERLLDLGGTFDLLAELVLRCVADQQGRAGLGHATRDAAADPRRQELRRIARQCARQVSSERDEHEIVVVTEKHAAVVVVDQEVGARRRW